MRNNWRMEQLQQKLKAAAMTENDPKRRSRLWHLYYLSLDVQADYEEIMRESEMIGARNPAFEGDYVGWLDDDFEDRPQLLGHQFKKDEDEKDKQDSEDSKDSEQQDNIDDDKKS